MLKNLCQKLEVLSELEELEGSQYELLLLVLTTVGKMVFNSGEGKDLLRNEGVLEVLVRFVFVFVFFKELLNFCFTLSFFLFF